MDSRLSAPEIYDIEVDNIEYEKAKQRMKFLKKNNFENTNIVMDDFFAFYYKKLSKMRFNAIIGNPPFIRYQNFNEMKSVTGPNGIRRRKLEHDVRGFLFLRELYLLLGWLTR